MTSRTQVRRPRRLAGQCAGNVRLWLAAAVVLAGGWSAPVQAEGKNTSTSRRLGTVTSAVSTQQSKSASRPNAGPPASGTRPSAPSRPISAHDGYIPVYLGGYGPNHCPMCVPVLVGSPPAGGSTHRGPAPKTRFDIEVGLQAVYDSDGAATAGLHLSKAGLGLAARATRYVERTEAVDGSDTVHLDLWHVDAAFRIVNAEATQLWVQGGLGGADSNEFAAVIGPVLGLELEHRIADSMRLRGSGRYFFLERDTRAGEFGASFAISVWSIGYRLLQFNAGPPLHGPELGLQIRF